MSNRFVIKNGFLARGNSQITGSLTIANSLIVSSSVETDTVEIYGTGSAVPIFKIVGSQGELFSVVDSLSGSLFAVSNQQGQPILEVFSDNRILMGDFNAPSLYYATKSLQSTGDSLIYTFNTGSYDAVYVDYHIRSGSDSRVGNIMATFDPPNATVNFLETSASQFGDTSGLTFGFNITGSNLYFSSSATSDSWTVKTIIRSI